MYRGLRDCQRRSGGYDDIVNSSLVLFCKVLSNLSRSSHCCALPGQPCYALIDMCNLQATDCPLHGLQLKRKKMAKDPYMPLLVQGVVCQFEFLEGNGLLHPVATQGRRFWVDVCPAWGLWLGFPCNLPLVLVPLGRRRRNKTSSRGLPPCGLLSPPQEQAPSSNQVLLSWPSLSPLPVPPPWRGSQGRDAAGEQRRAISL